MNSVYVFFPEIDSKIVIECLMVYNAGHFTLLTRNGTKQASDLNAVCMTQIYSTILTDRHNLGLKPNVVMYLSNTLTTIVDRKRKRKDSLYNTQLEVTVLSTGFRNILGLDLYYATFYCEDLMEQTMEQEGRKYVERHREL